MKKENPILFSAPMVNAILEGRKTMTRRIIKNSVDDPKLKCLGSIIGDEKHNGKFGFGYTDERVLSIIKPKYEVGDILWVRETYTYEVWENDRKVFIYKADNPNYPLHSGDKWKPSIFMPRKAARIFLEVTNVRVERLQDISESDAIAEGVELVAENEIFGGEKYTGEWYKNYGKEGYTFLRPIDSFRTLWESINGEGSWEKNPFVFVYEFKSVEL